MGRIHAALSPSVHWVAAHVYWMWPNFALAAAPAFGAFVLGRYWHRLPVLRWVVLIAAALLLPNAPYVVTDVVHLREWVRWAPAPWGVWLGVIPFFAGLVATGVLSFAYCMHVMRRRMRFAGWSRRRRIAVEGVVDGACALGVCLGRISRLNSWDIVRPDRVWHGLRVVTADPRAVALALLIVVVADVVVDWLASQALHRLLHRLLRR